MWYLYSELWLEWDYSYDSESSALLFILYQLADSVDKKWPIKIRLEVEPFSSD